MKPPIDWPENDLEWDSAEHYKAILLTGMHRGQRVPLKDGFPHSAEELDPVPPNSTFFYLSHSNWCLDGALAPKLRRKAGAPNDHTFKHDGARQPIRFETEAYNGSLLARHSRCDHKSCSCTPESAYEHISAAIKFDTEQSRPLPARLELAQQWVLYHYRRSPVTMRHTRGRPPAVRPPNPPSSPMITTTVLRTPPNGLPPPPSVTAAQNNNNTSVPQWLDFSPLDLTTDSLAADVAAVVGNKSPLSHSRGTAAAAMSAAHANTSTGAGVGALVPCTPARPAVTSLSPDQGTTSTIVTLHGSHVLGGDVFLLTYDGAALASVATRVVGSRIVFDVPDLSRFVQPANGPRGVRVVVRGHGGKFSNAVDFVYTAPGAGGTTTAAASTSTSVAAGVSAAALNGGGGLNTAPSSVVKADPNVQRGVDGMPGSPQAQRGSMLCSVSFTQDLLHRMDGEHAHLGAGLASKTPGRLRLMSPRASGAALSPMSFAPLP